MKKKDGKHKIFALGVLLFVITMIVLPYSVTAKDQSTYQVQVKSVHIQEGDTLWSIAKQHYTKEFKSMNSYIKEIKRSNGLYSDTIHEGNYIVVPYYAKTNN